MFSSKQVSGLGRTGEHCFPLGPHPEKDARTSEYTKILYPDLSDPLELRASDTAEPKVKAAGRCRISPPPAQKEGYLEREFTEAPPLPTSSQTVKCSISRTSLGRAEKNCHHSIW